MWWAWLRRPVSLQWSTEHLVQLHDFCRESHYPGKDRNGHLWQLFWRTERWGTIPLRGASGFRRAECRQQLSLSGTDTNQSTCLGWKTQSLFFSWPSWTRICLICPPHPSEILDGVTLLLWSKQKAQENSCPTKVVSRSRAHSSVQNLMWYLLPGHDPQAVIIRLTHWFWHPLGLDFPYLALSENEPEWLFKSFWTQIKRAAYGTARIFRTVPQTHGRVVILQETVFRVCLD